MTLSMADRASKTQKIKVVPISGNDPEAQRGEMIKVSAARMSEDTIEVSVFQLVFHGILLL